jgi:hypothetical protein
VIAVTHHRGFIDGSRFSATRKSRTIGNSRSGKRSSIPSGTKRLKRRSGRRKGPRLLGEHPVEGLKEFAESRLRAIQKADEVTLRSIEGRIAQLTQEESLGDEWTISTQPMTSLVPRIVRKSDQCIEQRNHIIDQNLKAPTSRICVLLDKHFSRDGIVPPGFLPERWTERFAVRNFVNAYRDPRCRNCVEKMISLRRRQARYLRN